MGGQIGYRPNPEGRGSIFWFTLFVEEARHATPKSALDLDLSNLELDLSNKRILLVEDNPINQRVMYKMLTRLGLTMVELADDGHQGMEKFLEGSFDLVLMENNMPILDGLSATRMMRASGYTAIPIIAITANALDNDVEAYIHTGFSDHIAKPVDRKVLVKLLVKCTSSRSSAGYNYVCDTGYKACNGECILVANVCSSAEACRRVSNAAKVCKED
jgi:osomolarity two-component system sensor histidine kinase TcsA